MNLIPVMVRPRPDLPTSLYRRAVARPGIDLFLDGNEGPAAGERLREAHAELPAESLRRYPSAGELEAALAARFGVPADHVVVGAGADELLDRTCRAYLAPGRALLMPSPGFAMLPRYVALAGGTLRTVPWRSGAFPRAPIVAAAEANDTAVVAITSPNNPTGLVCTATDLIAVASAAPKALLLVDLAYAEFAEDDLTSTALSLANALVVRTFSKAYGLAGLRVGYALGRPELVLALRACGSPYPCAGPSLLLAQHALAAGPDPRALVQLQRERTALQLQLQRYGFAVTPSQGNFVFAEARNAAVARSFVNELAARGIAVRDFAADPELAAAVRITCPGDPTLFARLTASVAAAGGPA